MDASARPAPPAPGRPTQGIETIESNDRVVACDGGEDALGHPRVFLYIEGQSVMCPYCSRLYVLKEGSDHASGA